MPRSNLSFLGKYRKDELVRYLASLHLYSQNSSNILRLSMMVYEALCGKGGRKHIHIPTFQKKIEKNYSHDMYEDPQEYMFVDLVHTPKGSYRVYPGIFTFLQYKRAVALFCAYSNVLAFVVLGILQLCIPNQKRLHGLLWLAMSIVCILFFICTNCYPNYAHICFPFSIIAMLELKQLYQETNSKKQIKALVGSLTLFILAINLFNGVYRAIQLSVRDSSPQKALYSAYDDVLSELPKESDISFIGYDILPEMYLRWNLRPHYRFFALHAFSRNYNIELYGDTQDEFMQGDAQWALVNYKIGLPRLLQEFFAKRYEIVKQVGTTDGELVLYKRVGK